MNFEELKKWIERYTEGDRTYPYQAMRWYREEKMKRPLNKGEVMVQIEQLLAELVVQVVVATKVVLVLLELEVQQHLVKETMVVMVHLAQLLVVLVAVEVLEQ